ncbi:MAG: phosphatidylglycerol lysyltransferase [Treponema sp.]|jgi:phosphoglucomutase|nr:phosphatidylglycerol lysyltransferase [Treponema sp.]
MLLNIQDSRLDGGSLKKALEGMILSPSGWRGVFAAGGGEEHSGEELSPPHGIIAAAGAAVFAEYLAARFGGRPELVLGRDTRPTGKALADTVIRALLASGCRVRYTGVAAAPEIMAFARSAPGGSRRGFCYLSASHNPIGHNGLKFGLDDGGVLEGEEAEKLIAALRTRLDRSGALTEILTLLEGAAEERIREVYGEEGKTKEEALGAYRDFAGRVAGNRAVLDSVTEGLRTRPLGIAADFNGSARTLSIDKDFCRSLGIRFHEINAFPGEIAHAIIPEGASLEPCRIFLEDLHRQDPSVLLGYTPDCDGDRGNLVIWDDTADRARILEAQEVFALSCMAELAQLAWTGKRGNGGVKAAVAVNGPTSMRINRIAAVFGASVFRAEVGEANVVNLARRLRQEGYVVPILGEGSNGGNITHPSSVRDPLATVFALVKLLTLRGDGQRPGLFDIWRRESSAGASASIFSLPDIIASLPRFFTTGTTDPLAKLQVKTKDHALLKDRYQRIFEGEWERKKGDLKKRWGIEAWEARACVGAGELRNLSRFGGAGTGGLKIVFKTACGGAKSPPPEDESGETAFIWMRGSKTEPVFRIMADAEGSADLERELIEWQRTMTAAADAAAG